MTKNSNTEKTNTNRSNASKSLAGKWQHRFFYLLLASFGLRPAYFVLYFVALWFTLLPSVRAKSADYLQQRFGKTNALKRFWQNFCLNHNFAKVLLERAALGILGRIRKEHGINISKNIVPDAYHRFGEKINSLLAEGNGLILLSAHAGCWQWALSGTGFLKQKTNILERREPGDVDMHYFQHKHFSKTIKIIDIASEFGGTLEVLNALKNNEVVCMMGDRAYSPKQQIGVDFLGRKAYFPIGPYHLAASAKAPILIMFILDNPACEANLDFMVFDVLRPNSKKASRKLEDIKKDKGLEPAIGSNSKAGSDSKAELFRPEAEFFVAALEEVCKKYPLQYYNYYKLWS